MADHIDDLIIKQHHEMVVMKPTGQHKVTLIGRRLYSALLATSQQELNGVVPLATHTFEAPLKSLLKFSGSDGDERTLAKKYFQEMQELPVSWESTAPGDGVKWIGLNMLSQAKIFVRGGQTWVSWAFPPEIMTMIVNPDRYAVWNLRVSAQLGTYSALALYEICARYRDNPSGVTSRKSSDWWIDSLSNTATGFEKKKREWRKFKLEKVKDAIVEINAETDLEIELIEHKAGRSVSEIQFSVRRRKNLAAINNLASINLELVSKAGRLGITEARAETLIRAYGEEKFSEKLDELRARIFDKSKSPIENQYAYLKVILKNSQLGVTAAQTKSDVQSMEVNPATISALATTVSTVNATEEANAVRHITKELNELPEVVLREWIDKAVVELKAAKMYNTIVQKRSFENKIGPGPLGGKVVSIYALATYGKNWRTISFAVPLSN